MITVGVALKDGRAKELQNRCAGQCAMGIAGPVLSLGPDVPQFLEPPPVTDAPSFGQLER